MCIKNETVLYGRVDSMKIATMAKPTETWYVIVEINEGYHVGIEGSTKAVKLFAHYAMAGKKVYVRSSRDEAVRDWVSSLDLRR